MKVFRQLRIIYGMGKILVSSGLGKIHYNRNIEDYGLLVLPFVGKGPENAVELEILERNLARSYYHTNRTIAAVRDTPVTANQMLRAVA